MPYSTQFRDDAVRLVAESGQSVRAVGEQLQVHPDTLRRWVRDSPPGGQETAPDAERATSRANPLDVPLPNAAAADDVEPTQRRRQLLPVGIGDYRLYTEAGALRPLPPVAITYLAVTALWGLSVSLSALLRPTAALERLAVTVHVLALVVSFGSVLLVDWHGLLWLAARRELRECTRVAEGARPLIWAGLAGLLASGTLLRPDLSHGLVWVKLGAVLVILLNGVSVNSLAGDLDAAGAQSTVGAATAARLRRRLFASSTLSALSWWTAIVIGLITDVRRR